MKIQSTKSEEPGTDKLVKNHIQEGKIINKWGNWKVDASGKKGFVCSYARNHECMTVSCAHS